MSEMMAGPSCRQEPASLDGASFLGWIYEMRVMMWVDRKTIRCSE